jgi:predicted SAM-dependent methyltransferase
MRVLNLGCGTKVSDSDDVINIDWSMYLRLKSNPLARPVAPVFLAGERKERFRALPGNVMVHDLSKGLPFDSDSVDAVYHSHLLEHLDRDVVGRFLAEVGRVLKEGGVQRIVVPDLEVLCRDYLSSLESSTKDPQSARDHDEYVARILEQSVRREASGTSQQRPLRRRVENTLLGDARRRGETHQWMYDRVNLGALLEEAGWRDVTVQAFNTSRIPNWSEYGLDQDERGHEYKPGSLYLEAAK